MDLRAQIRQYRLKKAWKYTTGIYSFKDIQKPKGLNITNIQNCILVYPTQEARGLLKGPTNNSIPLPSMTLCFASFLLVHKI